MKIYPNFSLAIAAVSKQLRELSSPIPAGRWQSTDMSKDPAAQMREVLNISFQVGFQWNENPQVWADDIQPNMPWAEDHFLERVSGEPLNPGVQWRNWPWSNHADKFRTEGGGKFSHTYMERFWPKYAGHRELLDAYEKMSGEKMPNGSYARAGIRYKYGDLNDVVDHLLGDPNTRQAYLPIWFPEDTGVVHGERVPCTLGYHFIQRNGFLHSTYYIRSCDFYRHFRDDLYLSVRLQLWMLQQLRDRELSVAAKDEYLQPQDLDNLFWRDVRMGMFTFHCVSMHMFINDWNKLYGTPK